MQVHLLGDQAIIAFDGFERTPVLDIADMTKVVERLLPAVMDAWMRVYDIAADGKKLRTALVSYEHEMPANLFGDSGVTRVLQERANEKLILEILPFLFANDRPCELVRWQERSAAFYKEGSLVPFVWARARMALVMLFAHDAEIGDLFVFHGEGERWLGSETLAHMRGERVYQLPDGRSIYRRIS